MSPINPFSFKLILSGYFIIAIEKKLSGSFSETPLLLEAEGNGCIT